MTILDLTGTPKVTRSGFGTNVAGLTAKLNRAAAKALNGAFGVTAFKKGRARQGQGGGDAVRDRAARHGPTALAIDPAVLQAIVGQGITPGVVGPATLDAARTASFPITGGLARARPERGQVTHSGGLSLTKGATVVNLTDYDIRVAADAAAVRLAQRRRRARSRSSTST